MKKLDERNITRSFLDNINETKLELVNLCTKCSSIPCLCKRVSIDLEDDYPDDGDSYSTLDPNNDGYVTKDDLFGHFDLDNDGVVTTDEYVDHVNYHANNPESLDKYNDNKLNVPCEQSYNTCKDYYTTNQILSSCITDSGATCMQSGIQALIDVLTLMKDKGVI